jgi:hypothetical protein
MPFWALGRTMRPTIALAPLLLLSLVHLSADITPIIELSKDDSAKAQAVRDNLAQTQQAYQALERQMYRGYVKDSTTKGFPAPLYSADFHFLVGAGDPAPVMELSKEDTTQMVQAYSAFLQALQDIETFHQHIIETYIAVRGSEKAAVSFGNPLLPVPAERAAFQHFRYTEDYHFILPK